MPLTIAAALNKLTLRQVRRLTVTSSVMLTEFCVHFGIEDAAAAGADSLPIGKGTHADGCDDVFGFDRV